MNAKVEFLALGFDLECLSVSDRANFYCNVEELLCRLAMSLPMVLERKFHETHELTLLWEYQLQRNGHAWNMNDTLMEYLFVKQDGVMKKIHQLTRTHLYMTGDYQRIFRFGVYFYPSICRMLHVKDRTEFFKEAVPLRKEAELLIAKSLPSIRSKEEVLRELLKEKLKTGQLLASGLRSGNERIRCKGIIPMLFLVCQAVEALIISLDEVLDDDPYENRKMKAQYMNLAMILNEASSDLWGE